MVTPIVILARMGSERFPGKHMALLNGKPMIVGIIERLRDIAPVVVATGYGQENHDLCGAAIDAGADAWMGSECNVWERIMSWSLDRGHERWVMYFGDCPFVDPAVVVDMLRFVETEYHDRYIVAPTWNGIEGLFCFGWTRWGWAKLGAQLHAHPEFIECPWAVPQEVPLDAGELIVSGFKPEQTGIKMSIDYPLELAVANRIVDYIGHWPQSYDEIIAAYKNIVKL